MEEWGLMSEVRFSRVVYECKKAHGVKTREALECHTKDTVRRIRCELIRDGGRSCERLRRSRHTSNRHYKEKHLSTPRSPSVNKHTHLYPDKSDPTPATRPHTKFETSHSYSYYSSTRMAYTHASQRSCCTEYLVPTNQTSPYRNR